jgi:hypothetical protein
LRLELQRSRILGLGDELLYETGSQDALMDAEALSLT